ncbi:DUF4240 domain-containing protein [Pseudoalteromonas fenneropenaei]|uniref:DUF4240 domain-containing protein n=1 Tax=Pseudoalteromonas fenneropenaei TaxID=1737459 RepID=A0ABV7CJ31_9GAMM
MEISQFWQIVTLSDLDLSNSANEQLKTRLEALNDSALAEFDALYTKQLRGLWHWDIWAAAYVLCGCNTEYDFLDFCNWLISQGETVVALAKSQPDELADYQAMPIKDGLPYPYCDELDLVAGLLYESRNGDELPYHSVVNFAPQGKKFKDKPKQLKLDFPKLYAKYWQQH